MKQLAKIALVAVLFFPLTLVAQRPGSEPVPEPAMPAIIAAFDKYEVVGMPEGHGMKDQDDFILSLIRNPAFADKVNDIAVECGNSLYQPVLDRYIAGENVPFAEVRKVWRNTVAGTMCNTSAFFEQFFPLVRAINQKLPAGRKLRVLAGDPPIDWDKVKTVQDINKYAGNRDESIASVMEKEVLSKHRKALMLFGTYHLMHGLGFNAVSIYEKKYPNVTFVIDGLGIFDSSSSPFPNWPMPALAPVKGTWLGALDISHFYPGGFYTDKDCSVHGPVFFTEAQKPMAELVDAVLYLGPRDLALREQMPADIALDSDYMAEIIRRGVLQGYPGASSWTLKDMNQQIVNGAEYPLYGVPTNPDPKLLERECLARKNASSTSK